MPTSTRNKDTTLRGGKGNFANDPQRASEAGRKGGQHSHMRSDSHGGTHGRHAKSDSQSDSHSRSTEDMEDEE